jgi:hypothetical protein
MTARSRSPILERPIAVVGTSASHPPPPNVTQTELNVVLARKLWPRSLSGELLAADKQVLRDPEHSAQLDQRQHIAVSFEQRVGQPNGGEAREERSDEAG